MAVANALTRCRRFWLFPTLIREEKGYYIFVKHSRYYCDTMSKQVNIKNESNGGSILGTDIVLDRRPFTSVTEGQASVFFPSSQDVFYNPVQEFNRDMSVAVLRVFAAEYRKFGNGNKSQLKLWAGRDTKDVTQSSNPDQEFFEKSNERGCNNFESRRENDEKEQDKEKSLNESRFKILPPGEKDACGIRILEALAASGLRSVRYAKEVGGVQEIVANDLSSQAVECMKQNIQHNEVGNIVIPSHNDASMVMYTCREPKKQFHAIDLDPYGSPHLFLDGAVQSVSEGGILLVTCTDMAVLCGNSPETCYSKYGAVSLKSKACHEIALRIVLQCIESHANRYGRYIIPLLSMSADFYVRVVVQVFTSQKKCKETFSKIAWIYQCVGCETATLQPIGRILVNGLSVRYQPGQGPVIQPNCSHCGHKHNVGGPVWADPIYDKNFLVKLNDSLVEKDFKTFRRMKGVITMMQEELNSPLFFVLDKLSSVVGMSLCKMVEFRSALLNGGYQVSMSHTCKSSVKTNAPPEFVWDIVRSWEKLHPVKKEKMDTRRPAGFAILSKAPEHKISFEIHADANPESRKQTLLRFQINPERYWGPKEKAKTSLFHEDQSRKKERNQGKKKRARESLDLKQYPCKKYKQGSCELGTNCVYSHEGEEVLSKGQP